ncbi:biotin/lipoyl-binding protein [Vibrio wakamikoensis]|jgi:multidrug resistance efflux pump|uniref:HlyD family secretion protein n=1 Tax=Vibrio chaetopteri TaxID=3016528 RepID=A0AAU8BHA5_9VIBR
MLEGLAVWALFIYLLRWAGMPWNRFTKVFAYLGGTSWLMFVWVGLLNYAPMDLSGGALVQSPHIQLRPDSTNVTGKVTSIEVKPNQIVSKGQLVYTIDDTLYKSKLTHAVAVTEAAKLAVEQAYKDTDIAHASYGTAQQKIITARARIDGATTDLDYQTAMLSRYKKQNKASSNSITQSDIDKQASLTKYSELALEAYEAELAALEIEKSKARFSVEKAQSTIEVRLAELDKSIELQDQAAWDLKSTKVRAPTDGFVTNFILREGQRVSVLPRIQMYTDEKYVLMRVNHQAIRNIAFGAPAEFSSSVYPGKIFAAEVEGIVEATGEAQSNLFGWDQNVNNVAQKNLHNKTHFVRLKIVEPEGYDIPVGSVGHAWVSGRKPVALMSFLDMIRAIIIRMNSQLYYFYSV